MNSKSYDYKHRKGVKEISWEDFGKLSMTLSELLSKENIDIIIGIARAGLFPATAVSCMLRKEIYPVRITRRFIDKVVAKKPQWKVPLPFTELPGKAIVIIDEITDTGETLSMVKEEVQNHGAGQVITACLLSHTWANPKPDYMVLETDELVLFPWDVKIYTDGEWIIHPEYADALDLQRKDGQ